MASGGIEYRGLVRKIGDKMELSTGFREAFGRSALTAMTGLPERLFEIRQGRW